MSVFALSFLAAAAFDVSVFAVSVPVSRPCNPFERRGCVGAAAVFVRRARPLSRMT